MSQPAKSIEKVHYEFRPAKQVERRMLLETLQRLMCAGYPIYDYCYLGMGSIYFIDFTMFHRYLGIHKMLSVEESKDKKKRVAYNAPFRYVRTVIGDIHDYIPTLSQEEKHFVWLDYDHIVTERVIDTVTLAAAHLSPQSILLVTIDVEPPGLPKDGPREWMEHYLREAERYLNPDLNPEDFAHSKLPSLNAMILERAIREGLSGRRDVHFCPMFHFLYADGHQMLSVGGMIGQESDDKKLKAHIRQQLSFTRGNLTRNPYKIRVPRLTRKERLYMDRYMPCSHNWRPSAFELKSKDVRAYNKIYKYYPSYTEMFL